MLGSRCDSIHRTRWPIARMPTPPADRCLLHSLAAQGHCRVSGHDGKPVDSPGTLHSSFLTGGSRELNEESRNLLHRAGPSGAQVSPPTSTANELSFNSQLRFPPGPLPARPPTRRSADPPVRRLVYRLRKNTSCSGPAAPVRKRFVVFAGGTTPLRSRLGYVAVSTSHCMCSRR